MSVLFVRYFSEVYLFVNYKNQRLHRESHYYKKHNLRRHHNMMNLHLIITSTILQDILQNI